MNEPVHNIEIKPTVTVDGLDHLFQETSSNAHGDEQGTLLKFAHEQGAHKACRTKLPSPFLSKEVGVFLSHDISLLLDSLVINVSMLLQKKIDPIRTKVRKFRIT